MGQPQSTNRCPLACGRALRWCGDAFLLPFLLPRKCCHWVTSARGRGQRTVFGYTSCDWPHRVLVSLSGNTLSVLFRGRPFLSPTALPSPPAFGCPPLAGAQGQCHPWALRCDAGCLSPGAEQSVGPFGVRTAAFHSTAFFLPICLSAANGCFRRFRTSSLFSFLLFSFLPPLP